MSVLTCPIQKSGQGRGREAGKTKEVMATGGQVGCDALLLTSTPTFPVSRPDSRRAREW